MNKEKMTQGSMTYLGDGLYAVFDGFMIELWTERENGKHYVALEPEVFASLMKYAKDIGWLKTEGKWDA